MNKSPETGHSDERAEQPHAERKQRRQLLGSLPVAPLHLECLLALRGKIQKSADKKL
jgi:hypothetical protein